MDCGHKLRVELDGQKISLIHFNFHGIHKTPYASPAFTFPLGAPPHGLDLDTLDTLDVYETHETNTPLSHKTYNLTNLMTSALIEGIEEAHWEQRRIRSTTAAWHIDHVYTNSMAWVDAAWDEIQARREEENSAPFSAEDAVESHY